MELENTVKSSKRWAIIIGIGLALFPLHNLWLTNVTSIGGMTLLFLPAIGAIIWIMAVLLFIRNNWRNLDWGDKKILIPLLVIVVSMGLSGFINGDSLGSKVAPLFIGLAFLSAYVVARSLGKDIFKMLIPFVCLGAVISIVMGVLTPSIPDDGFITNYAASAGFLIFGVVVNPGKKQWMLIFIVLAGLFFIGALEAVFIVGVIGVVVLARRDVNKYSLIPIGALVVAIAVLALNGNLTRLYGANNNMVYLFDMVTGKIPLNMGTLNSITSQRWEVYLEGLERFNFIGHGYSLNLMKGRNIHNVPLMIMDQIGVLAAIAWLGLSVYCAIKTKWHYAWVAVLAMGVFDHYIWTQFGAMWWVLIGVSTSSTIKSDLIFRRIK